jgi:hypothetical protein
MFPATKASDNHHQVFQPANYTGNIKDDLSSDSSKQRKFMPDFFSRQQSKVAPKRQSAMAPSFHGFLRDTHQDVIVPMPMQDVPCNAPLALRMYNAQQKRKQAALDNQLHKPMATKPIRGRENVRSGGVMDENKKPPPVLCVEDLKNVSQFADLKGRRGGLKTVASPSRSKVSTAFVRELIEDEDPFGPPIAGFEDEEVFQIDL